MLIPKCVIHCLLEQIPSNHELLASMKLELTLFVSYAEAYHNVFNSIFWNGFSGMVQILPQRIELRRN